MTRRSLLSLPLIAPVAKALGWMPTTAPPHERKVLVYVHFAYTHEGRFAIYEQTASNPTQFASDPATSTVFCRMSPVSLGMTIAGQCERLTNRPQEVILAFDRDAFHHPDKGPSVAEIVTFGAAESGTRIRFQAVYQ